MLTRPGFLGIAFFVLLVTCRAGATSEVYILHTNNTNGALENCLCPGKSYGSLEKRVHFIRQWLADHPNTLVLDAGDFLSATSNALKDSIAFRAYEMIPYDAIALGDQEFFRGVNFISDLINGSRLPFLSTNLEKPLISRVQREIVVSRGEATFGILSVLDPGVFRFYPKKVSEAVEFANYDDRLEEKLKSLREEVDVVVVLSHLGIDGDRDLASEFPAIDVVVGSHTQSVMEEPEKVGNTIIVQAGKDGYYVGELKLVLNEANKIESYEGKLVAMDIVLPNDPAVVEMIVEYNRLSRLRTGKRVERIAPIPASFLVSSSENCGVCHQPQLDHWATTGHAVSFESLKHNHKEKSPDCLACHTTGFGRDDGYLNYNITAGLKNVNCSECHYVPSGHLADPVSYSIDPISEEGCIRCHDEANSPQFEFGTYVSEIKHPVILAQKVEPEKVGVPPVGEETRKIEDKTATEVSEAEEKAIVGQRQIVAETMTEASRDSITHFVLPGETLWSLAERYLGTGSRWREIYELNRDVIQDPNLIFVEQSLRIPDIKKGK